jgi:gamma-glutamyltranspeptidase / glutathione hydrolase
MLDFALSARQGLRTVALALATMLAAHGALGAQLQEAPATVRTTGGVVSSQQWIASDVGAEVLAAGGNAVDAAIATGFALAVTHPTPETSAAAASW